MGGFGWHQGRFGRGSKICTQNGILVNGNMDQNLRCPGGLILTPTQMLKLGYRCRAAADDPVMDRHSTSTARPPSRLRRTALLQCNACKLPSCLALSFMGIPDPRPALNDSRESAEGANCLVYTGSQQEGTLRMLGFRFSFIPKKGLQKRHNTGMGIKHCHRVTTEKPHFYNLAPVHKPHCVPYSINRDP